MLKVRNTLNKKEVVSMLYSNKVIRRLKSEVRRLKAENKLMKLQLTPISEIDFGWGNKRKRRKL